MTKAFYGQFSVTIDLKGRLSLPSCFRFEKEFILTNNRYKNLPCLDVYPQKTWQDVFEKKTDFNKGLNRFYFYSGRSISKDRQSRILIPLEMRKYAELEKKKVVLIGVNKKFEIWSEKNWKKFYSLAFKGFNSVLSEIVLDEKDNA